MVLRLLTAIGVFLVTSLWAQAPPAKPLEVSSRAADYAGEFDRRFPLVAGSHQVVDWNLYTALVSGDIVGYAVVIDPQLARSIEQTTGKGYQTQQLQERIRQDDGLRAAFVEQRGRMATMTLATAEDGSQHCRAPLVYVAKEFRLVLGESRSGEDPLVRSLVAPRCGRVGDSAVQITAGESARFRCWTADHATSCGWRLPDMPVELKRVIEDEYPANIRARWRWRGLGGVKRVRFPGMYGGAADGDQVALTVPVGLALEFIDGSGQIRWTADSEGWSAGATTRKRP
jgi:hypothetical protein